jgi:hypothetical protein
VIVEEEPVKEKEVVIEKPVIEELVKEKKRLKSQEKQSPS